MTRGYTDDELLDALRAFAADEYDRPPTAIEANAREGFPSSQTFVEHFGSWNEAVAAAGLRPRNRRRSDEELLDDLHDLAESGTYPTTTAVRDREDMAAAPTYKNRFGSWSAALDAAGLPVFDNE